MAQDRRLFARTSRVGGCDCQGQPQFCKWRIVGIAQWSTLEAPTRRVWKLEECSQAFYALGQDWFWERIFHVSLTGSDNTYIMIDSTIVRAHQQAVCGKGGAKARLWGVPEED